MMQAARRAAALRFRLAAGSPHGTARRAIHDGARVGTQGRAAAAATATLAASGAVTIWQPTSCQVANDRGDGTTDGVAAQVPVVEAPLDMSVVLGWVSALAALGPTLCAIHCAVMPVATVLLPTLAIFPKVCMHSFAKKLAYYFVIPFGLLSNCVGYPQHKNEAVCAASLSGISMVTAAAAWKPVAAYRNYLNISGCCLMLGSQYYGNQLAQAAGTGCGCCGNDDGHCN